MVVLRELGLLIIMGSIGSVNKGLVTNTGVIVPPTGAIMAGVRAFQKGW